MAAFNKIEQFVEDMAHGVHDFETDQVRVALTNAANAPVTTNSILGDLTEIPYTNLLEADRDVTTTSSGHTTGTYRLILTDLVLTAVGGAALPFQYVVHYNEGGTGPVNPLVNWYNHGSEVTLAEDETFTIDYNPTNGFFSLA